MINRGDIVRIRPEWAEPGEENVTFVAVDDEGKGRVSIMAMLGLPINPVHVVKIEMVEKVIGASSPRTGGHEGE